MSLLKPATAIFLMASTLTLAPVDNNTKNLSPEMGPVQSKTNPKIQVAILLDVSNSMDGLIEQAKAQLWNMVSVMGKAKCNDATPGFEIALYEYGRDNNSRTLGYVKQINSFTTDLDQVSKNLFSLTTNGGDEFCGHVIYTSINELKWDTANSSYKVIFIAGNEDFLQGDITYTKACSAARDRGVIVNTIYCGDRMQGIREHWNLSAECGNGSFTNINSNAKFEEIPTPYDTTLMVLNNRLNDTYISYGYSGNSSRIKQMEVDKINTALSPSVMAARVGVKGKSHLYKNESWDMVDAMNSDSVIIEKVDRETLPDTLKNKTPQELKRIVKAKSEERLRIQNEIGTVNSKREAFLAEERKKKARESNVATLETEMEKIIRQQANRFNMVIK